MIYLDNAATSLLKPASVGQAMSVALRTMASPGRGGHSPAMLAAETVYDCRAEAAGLFHVPEPERVVFTMNATHALNLAIFSLVRPGTKVLISGYEHNSVTRALHAAGAEALVAGRKLFDAQDCLEDFSRQIDRTQLVVCTQVSNVFGYILPLEEIAALCAARGVPLIVDASQSAGVLPLDFEALHAAFVAMPGHKALFGPQGTGLLLCGQEGRPLLHGGSGSESRLQEMPRELPDRLEAGTHNVCGIAGLLAGLRYVRAQGPDAILQKERALLTRLIEGLHDAELELFTGPEARQCGVLSLRCPWMDCEELGRRLSERGVCVRSGLHCAPTAHRSAGTLDTGTVRLSVSPFVTRDQIDLACDILREVIAR